MRTLTRTALGSSAKSPFVQVTRARKIDVSYAKKTLHPLDGGDRERVKHLEIEVEPGALTVCVPQPEGARYVPQPASAR